MVSSLTPFYSPDPGLSGKSWVYVYKYWRILSGGLFQIAMSPGGSCRRLQPVVKALFRLRAGPAFYQLGPDGH